jgi:rhodanese-related sulfurtransferase
MVLRQFFLFSVFLMMTFLIAKADELSGNILLPELKEIEVSGPYCGIYSLITILDTFDKHPDIKTLLVAEYIGSFKGSSNEELVKAAQANGLFAQTYGGLTWRELKTAKSPMILHFRSSFSDEKYNHWVAYLGVDGKHARIIDFPHSLETISFAELMAKWDGTAVVISDKPMDSNLVWSLWLHYLGIVGLLFCCIFCIQYFLQNKTHKTFGTSTFLTRMKRDISQTVLLFGTIFVVAILYHAISETGFLRNPTAVAEVTRRYYSVDIPEINLSEMQTIVKEKTIPIFDARYARDFKLGTIPEAKNIPINSSLSERQQILAGMDKHRRIVVFCQSAGCGYADEVAQFLKFNGYSNVVLYRGGYREWSNSLK